MSCFTARETVVCKILCSVLSFWPVSSRTPSRPWNKRYILSYIRIIQIMQKMDCMQGYLLMISLYQSCPTDLKGCVLILLVIRGYITFMFRVQLKQVGRWGESNSVLKLRHTWTEIRLNATWVYLGSKGTMTTLSLIHDPATDSKGILILAYRCIKRGLVSKLLMKAFSWRPWIPGALKLDSILSVFKCAGRDEKGCYRYIWGQKNKAK